MDETTSNLIGDVTRAGWNAESTALIALMLLIILALAWFVKYLINRNDAQNKIVIDALINNTAVISEFKEMVRASLTK